MFNVVVSDTLGDRTQKREVELQKKPGKQNGRREDQSQKGLKNYWKIKTRQSLTDSSPSDCASQFLKQGDDDDDGDDVVKKEILSPIQELNFDV